MPKRKPHLVVEHVERMSRTLFEDHPEVIRALVKGRQGVYALYRRHQLYYVGLASNLRNRLKNHLRDRHGERWDSFSMYLTDSSDHLRELEALVLRIAKPTGNRSNTKFAQSQDLRRHFKEQVANKQRLERDRLFGASAYGKRSRPAPGAGKRAPSLSAYVSVRTPIRMSYRGRSCRAVVRPDGTIRFRGQTYNSPSIAAAAVTKRPTNGWWIWRYESDPGVWSLLHRLRKR